MKKIRSVLALTLSASVLASACGASTADTTADTSVESTAGESAESDAGLRLVTAQDGATLQASPPDDLVILDVRTPEEFAEGHLEGAIMIDFYADDFADQLAELDPNVPYLMYCRSGNRSAKTTAILNDLGFTDVSEIDGGILAWDQAGLPTVNG